MPCREPFVRALKARPVWTVTVAVTAVIVCGAGFGREATLGAWPSHEATIEAVGSQVMPFDQRKTIHVFQKTDTGGIESVVAKDPDDQEQITLIRAHLAAEAQKFRQGNYEDPARIHGMDMPGLQAQEAGYTRVDGRYEDLPDGGHITYTSRDPALVAALHAWFDRQLMDHGANAQAQMPSTPAPLATP